MADEPNGEIEDSHDPQATVEAPGAPPVVDRHAFEAEVAALRAREKAHTHEGDAIAAARRRLPMVEVEASTPLVGPEGRIRLFDAFEGRRQLIAYYFMWHTGHPAAEQCEGCTWVTSQVTELAYLHSRDITYAVFCQGPYEESARYRDFMGWDVPWYSAEASLSILLGPPKQPGRMHLVCYLRQGERVFETYWTTIRGVEAMDYSYALMDLTVYGRQEPWEDSPPAGHNSAPTCEPTAAHPRGHRYRGAGRAPHRPIPRFVVVDQPPEDWLRSDPAAGWPGNRCFRAWRRTCRSRASSAACTRTRSCLGRLPLPAPAAPSRAQGRRVQLLGPTGQLGLHSGRPLAEHSDRPQVVALQGQVRSSASVGPSGVVNAKRSDAARYEPVTLGAHVRPSRGTLRAEFSPSAPSGRPRAFAGRAGADAALVGELVA